MDWLNDNAGAVQALATLVLVGVTFWYAHLTRKISEATRLSSRPSVAVDVLTTGHDLVLRVLNTGSRAAQRITIDVLRCTNKDLRDSLGSLRPVRDGLPYLAPGRRYDYRLSDPMLTLHDVFPRTPSDDTRDWSVQLEVSYRDGDDSFSESFEVDVKALEGLQFSSFDTDGTIVAKQLGNLGQTLKEMKPPRRLFTQMYTRPCVFCSQLIPQAATKCHHCGEWQEQPPLWRPVPRDR